MVLLRRFLSCSQHFSKFDVRQPRENFRYKFRPRSIREAQIKHYSSSPPRDRVRDQIVRSPYAEIDLPDTIINELLLTKVENWPDRVAVECSVSGKTYTFEQVRILSCKFAVSLRKEGLLPGDVISVLLPNIPDYVIVILGALQAGLIVSPNNPIYTPYELTHYLEDSAAKAIVTTVDVSPKLSQVEREIESKTNRTYSPKKIFIRLDPNDELPTGSLNYSYEDMISNIATNSEIPTNRRSEDVAFFSYSSGTTGLPKAVQLTHKNIVSNILQTADHKVGRLRSTTKDYQERLIACLPFFHMYGLAIILLRSIYHGCKMMTMTKFDTQRFIAVLQNHRPTVLHTVPPVLLWLGSSEMVTANNLASVNHILCAGAPHKPEDNESVLTKLKMGTGICQAYGATETGPVALISSFDKNDFASLSPVCNTTAKIVKFDGSLAQSNEEGEICIRGPQIMKGYLNKPELTKNVIDDDGFYHTGDIGLYNNEGAFSITDRIKELIKVKGFQVSPAELEAILRSHPCVVDAAVIGIPDARVGEKPIAYVVKDTNTILKVDEETLKTFVAHKLSPYKRLASVYFVDTIPKNLSGKILRRVLKEEYMKKHC